MKQSVSDRARDTFVDPLTQVFARLEVRDIFSGQGHSLARLRVSTLAWRTKMQRKTTEPTNLDSLTRRERVTHDLENLLQGELDILRRQMLLLGGNQFDEFRLRHDNPVTSSGGSRTE